MTHHQGLSHWVSEVSHHFPHLSVPQARVLAWWSFGIAFVRSCGRLSVATFLSLVLKKNVHNVEQCLYEWCVEAPRKSGTKRQELDVPSCFVPLLLWMVSLWHGTDVALTLDATTLGNRFVALVISVVYRGIGMPVAWTILPAAQKGEWMRSWLWMLRRIRSAIPRTWHVIVLTDRGLYSRRLFGRIRRLGWHPYMRVKRGTMFRPDGNKNWTHLEDMIPSVGGRWVGRGTLCKTKESQLSCTLLGWWGEEYEEPWFIVTDLDPTQCAVEWYALRGWCEQGFKCTKRGGWQWQQTQMTDPKRAERVWLALALAMFWMVSIGSNLEDIGTTDVLSPDEVVDIPDLRPLLPRGTQPRRMRLFRLGWMWLIAQAISGAPLPMPHRLVPEPWPDQRDQPHLNGLQFGGP